MPTRFCCTKKKLCHYTLKKHYRCKIYAQNLLFCLSKCRKLWILLKIPKNENETLSSKPKTAAKYMLTNSNISSQPIHPKKYYGGYKRKMFNYDFLEPYLTPDYPNTLDMKEHYLYIDHVNDASLCLYPTEIFVHTQIPLELLFLFLTLAQACKIALAHGINAGSQCNMKLLLTKIENHACLICNSSFSIFQINKSANQLALIRNKKMRNMNTNNNKKKSKTDIKIFEQLNNQKIQIII